MANENLRPASHCQWAPFSFDKDPTINAILNVAASIHELAEASGTIMYGLKYGRNQGMSVAEALEVAGGKVADAIREAGEQ